MARDRLLDPALGGGPAAVRLLPVSGRAAGERGDESTIRRVLNLRLKGTSLFWEEGNAEAVLQLRAAVLSGRWEERLERTREAMARTGARLGLGPTGMLGRVEGVREGDEE